MYSVELNTDSLDNIQHNVQTISGDFSVLFAYLFLLLFGQIDNIYKVEQDSLYLFS